MSNRGKLIVIEGTDCSGKETQTRKLYERLKSEGVDVFYMSFPKYDTPTGKIIGGPILGKPSICDSYFGDYASRIPAKVASLYYAADRLYNIEQVKINLDFGTTVILDRYISSNMAFQGSKEKDAKKRHELYKFIEELEYGLLDLPRPDETIFLHMPYLEAKVLKEQREEQLDRVESDETYLRLGEEAYLELAGLYNYKTIKCGENGTIRSIDDINDELYNLVKEVING